MVPADEVGTKHRVNTQKTPRHWRACIFHPAYSIFIGVYYEELGLIGQVVLDVFNDFIDNAVVYRFFGAHPKISINILFNLRKLLTGIFREDFI